MFRNIYLDILNNISDGVYYINSDRKIEYWNKGAEILTGYSLEDVRGKNCEEIFSFEDESGAKLPTYEYPAILCLQSSR